MNTQKGFAPLIIVGVIALVAIIVGVGYTFMKKSEVQENKPAIQEAQLPREEIQQPKDETADWKTYRNDSLGIEFRYPSNFFLNTQPSGFAKSAYSDDVDKFFELVDTKRSCYIGPLFERGLPFDVKVEEKTVETADNNKIIIKYVTYSDGDLMNGLVFLSRPKINYLVYMHLVNLSNSSIMSENKIISSDKKSINTDCVKDFEKIFSTFKFTQ